MVSKYWKGTLASQYSTTAAAASVSFNESN
jgi:hypothetical protein